MAKITTRIPRDLDWRADDALELYVGDENVADLASGDPAGGVLVVSQSPWPENAERGGLGFGALGDDPLGYSTIGYGLGEGELGYGALGIDEAPRVLIEHVVHPVDKCADLPVGVLITDLHGNDSALVETVAQISDPPRGARGLTVASTETPGEVSISFTESPDV